MKNREKRFILSVFTIDNTLPSTRVDIDTGGGDDVIEVVSVGTLPIKIDGEIQADVALDKYAAKQKAVAGEVAGGANVLIFPNLHSSNIAAKMVTILAGGDGYGQIMTGLSKPAAQVSRGASAHDIYATAVIVGAQATDRHLLMS